ncbi:MAG: HAMP domain-containing protein [bacterium]|nr:HAMP domain-containing protein [bacterium]
MNARSSEAVSTDARARFDGWLDRIRRGAGGFSVRTKILGIVLALTTVLGLVVTWQVRTVMTGVLMNELDNRGQSVVSDLAARTSDPILLNDTYGVFELLDDTVANHPDATYAFVLNSDGRVVAHTFGDAGFPTALLEINPSGDLAASGYLRLETDEGLVHDFQAPILDGRVGAVRLGLSEDRLSGVITGITTQMLITTVFVGLAGVAAASLLTWLLTRPILDLVKTTRDVGAGDLSARATHWADDEIGSLGVAFNRMVRDLEANRDTIADNEAARTRLLEQLIDAQEEERKRIARELHDGVGQGLSSLMVGMAVLTKSSTDEAVIAKREELQALAEETLDQVRQLGRELRPSALDDLGLAAALDRYAQDFEVLHPQLSVDLHVDLPGRLPPTAETNLYRIVQEGMTNAARHSSAGQLSVLVTRRNGLVKAIIEDNGQGFDPVAARRKGRSVGIHGMQERAELIGGKVTIESGRDGTSVFVEVPV